MVHQQQAQMQAQSPGQFAPTQPQVIQQQAPSIFQQLQSGFAATVAPLALEAVSAAANASKGQRGTAALQSALASLQK